MGTFIGSTITFFVVSLVLRLLSREKLDKKTSSIYKFTVRAGSFLATIGVLDAVFFIAMMVLGYFTGERSVAVYIEFGVFVALGLFLLILTFPGADEIHVDHDDITRQRAWLFKKHWTFSQIDYAKIDHNGMHVFVKGKKRQVFLVDNYYNGYENFHKRLQHDHIEIREKIMTEKDLEKEKKKWDKITWLIVIGGVAVCAIVYLILNSGGQ